MPQIEAVGGGRGIHSAVHHPANDLDPFEDVAPSTVSMMILFGSIIFATIGMAARDWLIGDKRAISAAMHLHQGKGTSTKSNANNQSRSGYADGLMGTSANTTLKVEPWEPSFISTFILFSHVGVFGIILFIMYALEMNTKNEQISISSGFDEDEFVFWIIAVVLYTYFISWKRNDGKPEHYRGRVLSGTTVADDATQTSRTTTSRSKMKEKIRQRTIEMASLRQAGDDGISSQGSESKRLEEVLLTDNTVFDSILDTIDDDIRSKDESELGLLEKGSTFFGFNVSRGSRAICNVKRENDILNRSHTLEWKGLISVVLLIYQYNMGECYQPFLNDGKSSMNGVQIYDNLAKAAMTSLLFLTGYNHTHYFLHQPTFKMSRVLKVCLRMNLLSVSLCFMFGIANYSACLLHTCWFLFIMVTMHFAYSKHDDKYLFRMKLLGAAVGIFLFWDCNTSRILKINGIWESNQTLQEWYCVSYIHHWAAFVGAIFAINQPIMSMQQRKLESLNFLTNVLAKSLLTGTLLLMTFSWAAGPLRKGATMYNVSHPYFGILPTLLLINVRSVSCFLREHHIGVLSWVGKYSLEIYVLHHHSSNIVFLKGYPRCNFLIISCGLIYTARLLHYITSVIRQMLLPDVDENECYQNTAMCAMGMMALYVFANILTWANAISFGTISTIVMIGGILVYQVMMETTWSEYRATLPKVKGNQYYEDDEEIIEDTSTMKVSPPLIATISILLMGYALQQAVLDGSSLHACNPYDANKGRWVPLNACLARTKLERNFNSINYFGPSQCATLNTTEQWTWPDDTCGFHYQSETELQLKLQDKRIVLIGDSTVRNLYHSLRRFLGDFTAGGYEGTSSSHSDASALLGSTSLEFKWAPLSVDIITKLKSLKTPLGDGDEPDIIIAGGGVWDKLHLSVTDEDQSSQENTIKTLASELRSMKKMFGAIVVWFVPPIINTMALNSDEKRAQISEGNLEEMRRMYAELGVQSSASFLLDGPKFTQDRASESFDGIHYPNHVYDAGSQVLFNGLDQLWGKHTNKDLNKRSYLPAIVSLINPYLGMMMLCFVVIGLFYFDGYFGVGYLPQFFVKTVNLSPSGLYGDAFKHNETSTATEQHSNGENEPYESINSKQRSTSSINKRR